MNARESTHWNRVLSEAHIDDIVVFHGLSVKVCEGYCNCTQTRKCAFFNEKYKKAGDEYCLLNRGEGVVPCLARNNCLCKSLTFVKIDY